MLRNVDSIWNNTRFWFTNIMDTQMFRNRHKMPWTTETVEDLMPRFTKKVSTVEALWESGDFKPVDLIEKLADAGNYAMMIADLIEKKEVEPAYRPHLPARSELFNV